MILGRATIYFDEVARRGSIRRASETLRIAPSAVDRQILKLEEHFGVALFERTTRGLRMTTAGEMLAETVRRWRRDLKRVEAGIEDLIGLRQGEVSIALIEGAAPLLKRGIAGFHEKYPGIAFRVEIGNTEMVTRLIISGEYDVGLTANAPDSSELRVERTLLYRLGLLLLPDHPLAGRTEIELVECAMLPLIVPNESNTLREVIDEAWARSVGGNLRHFIACNGINMVKSLVASGVGPGVVAALDAQDEVAAGQLAFVPFADRPAPLSILSLVNASERTLSVTTSLFINHMSALMREQDVPVI